MCCDIAPKLYGVRLIIGCVMFNTVHVLSLCRCFVGVVATTLLIGDGLSGPGQHMPAPLSCHVHLCRLRHVTLQERQNPAGIRRCAQFSNIWKNVHSTLSGNI